MGQPDPHMGSILAKALSLLGFLSFIGAIVAIFQLRVLNFLLNIVLSFVFMYLARAATIWRLKRLSAKEFNRYQSIRFTVLNHENPARRDFMNYQSENANQYLVQAVELGRSGRNQEALEYFIKAEGDGACSPDLYYAKGRVCVELGKYEEAIQSLDACIAMEPEFGFSWYFKAAAQEALGRRFDAINSYRQFLEFAPLDNPGTIKEVLNQLKFFAAEEKATPYPRHALADGREILDIAYCRPRETRSAKDEGAIIATLPGVVFVNYATRIPLAINYADVINVTVKRSAWFVPKFKLLALITNHGKFSFDMGPMASSNFSFIIEKNKKEGTKRPFDEALLDKCVFFARFHEVMNDYNIQHS